MGGATHLQGKELGRESGGERASASVVFLGPQELRRRTEWRASSWSAPRGGGWGPGSGRVWGVGAVSRAPLLRSRICPRSTLDTRPRALRSPQDRHQVDARSAPDRHTHNSPQAHMPPRSARDRSRISPRVGISGRSRVDPGPTPRIDGPTPWSRPPITPRIGHDTDPPRSTPAPRADPVSTPTSTLHVPTPRADPGTIPAGPPCRPHIDPGSASHRPRATQGRPRLDTGSTMDIGLRSTPGRPQVTPN